MRTTAEAKRAAIEDLLKGRLNQQSENKKLEVEGGGGVPTISTNAPAVTKESLSSGALRDRATARLEGILRSVTEKATGLAS